MSATDTQRGAPRQPHDVRPEVHRVVVSDQRGCGESLPHASDPALGLAHNTTHHLVADIERLREHLGIERRLLHGGSWGSTLILAYAEAHPERVSEIVISGVTMTRPDEFDWLYRGVGRLLPGPWEAFRDALPEPDRCGNLVAACDRLLNSPDEAVRIKAAWELSKAWPDAELKVIDDSAHTGSPAMRDATPYPASVRWPLITARLSSRMGCEVSRSGR